MAYFPYGGTRYTSGGLNTDKRFTGQRLDQDSLYYCNARYYDPRIGRFISADTIVPDPADPQSLNRYTYCYNNPLIYVDPTGHWGFSNIKKWFSNIANDVKETVGDFTNAIRSYMRMVTPTPDPAAYVRAKDNVDIIGMIDAVTGNASADSAGLLNALGSTPVSQGTEDSVAAAYASGDSAALTRAVGFAAAEATINVGVTLFGGSITSAVVGRVFGKVGGAVLPKTLARVVPGRGPFTTIGHPGAEYVYVTAAEDISGLGAKDLAARLAIKPSETYTIMQFSSWNIPASSVVKSGLTDGGAREWVIRNGPIPANTFMRIVR